MPSTFYISKAVCKPTTSISERVSEQVAHIISKSRNIIISSHPIQRLGVSLTNTGVLSCNRNTLCSMDQSSLVPSASSKSKCHRTLHRIRFISAHARLFSSPSAAGSQARHALQRVIDDLRFSQTVPRSYHKWFLGILSIGIEFGICIW